MVITLLRKDHDIKILIIYLEICLFKLIINSLFILYYELINKHFFWLRKNIFRSVSKSPKLWYLLRSFRVISMIRNIRIGSTIQFSIAHLRSTDTFSWMRTKEIEISDLVCRTIAFVISVQAIENPITSFAVRQAPKQDCLLKTT